MIARAALLALALGLAGTAGAGAPDSSPRPLPRPDAGVAEMPAFPAQPGPAETEPVATAEPAPGVAGPGAASPAGAGDADGLRAEPGRDDAQGATPEARADAAGTGAGQAGTDQAAQPGVVPAVVPEAEAAAGHAAQLPVSGAAQAPRDEEPMAPAAEPAQAAATGEAAVAAPEPAAALATAPLSPRIRPRPAPGRSPAAEAVAAPVAALSTGGRMAPQATVAAGEAPALRPRPRPARAVRPANPARDVAVVQVAGAQAVLRSPRPAPRPENLRRRNVVRAAGLAPMVPDPQGGTGRRGAICGDPAIRGERLSPIAGRVQGCGIAEPVRITEVDGVRLSAAATVDCATAQALRRWVSESVKPAVGRLGGGVASLQVYADYSCRTRNNQPGARVSEHGRGRAIDIGAINLNNGASITVLKGWRDREHGQLLRAMHRGACGPFGTVLGPDSDRFHQNHFHFDTARHRSGPFCR